MNTYTGKRSVFTNHSHRQKQHARLLSVVLLAVVLALLAAVPTARAQTYRFSVPELQMQVYVQEDASVRIVYDITFANQPSASPIDIVDIGTPHADYSISNMSASIDGNTLSTIRPSEYVSPGVEIPLGQHAIAAGETGTLHVAFTMPDMVYNDTTREDYASLQITPTWFDSDLVTGNGTVEIAVHMLPGIEADEVLYQEEPFTQKALFEGHVVAYWEFTDVRATRAFPVGVSFPDRGMNRVVEMNILQLAVKWLNDNPGTRTLLVFIVGILFTFIYFRFTGGTGFVLYIMIVGVMWFCGLLNIPELLLPALVAVPLLGVGNEMLLRARKKRASTYLPAVAEVEGGGIKRGLTAPEAAVILELPLSKVLTLVIFAMLKKGVLRQVEADPLTVEVEEDYRTSSRDSTKQRESRRLKVAAKHQTVLHTYEHGFLTLIEQHPGKPLKQIDFSTPMKSLITHTAQRLKGFDLSDTQDYYRRIIQRALAEARSIGDVEQREQALDRNLEWIVMNDRERYEDAFEWQDRSNRRYSYRPLWTRRSYGYYGPRVVPVPMSSSGTPGSDAPAPGGSTSFGDVAASFAGWTENTFGSMADAISPGALQVETPGGGLIDLSGADKGFFKALSESSSGGGGGGGGCACACAGCACACACAGGGR